MIPVFRESGWTFKTSSYFGGSGKLGVGVGGGSGTIVLQDPRTSAKIQFRYFQLGAGVGIGGNVINGGNSSVGGSTQDFPSWGKLWMTETFKGEELGEEDFEGIFATSEITVGEGAGYGLSALLLGISRTDYLRNFFTGRGLSSLANAALIMGGISGGISVGAGAMGYVGYLYEDDVIAEAAVLELKSIEQALAMKAQYSPHEDAPPIILPSDILFDFNKHKLKPAAKTALMNAGMKLRSYPGRHIQIQGFADGVGGASRHNQELSENRAAEVKNWLISKGMVNGSDISSKGYGIEYAVASNRTSSGRAKNRRVEIHILRP